MKRLFTLVSALAILCVTAISFQSCTDEKYTVWTETETYTEFQNAFQATLQDGHYVRYELSKEEWAIISKNLTSEGRHKWDEETIKKWLIGNGFGETEARKESSWFVLVDHGFIVVRDKNLVYLILK